MEEPGMSMDFGPKDTTKVIDMSRAFIESIDRSFAFRTRYAFHKDGKVETKVNQWMEVTK